MESTNTADAGRKLRLKSLSDLDGRTHAARKAHDLIASIEADLGGHDLLSAGQIELIKRAALSGAMLEDIEAGWLQGDEQVDLSDYSTLLNAQRRLLSTLGIERRPIDVPPHELPELRLLAAEAEKGDTP
jgi:hypothetical protein